jgi:hypothetical protein
MEQVKGNKPGLKRHISHVFSNMIKLDVKERDTNIKRRLFRRGLNRNWNKGGVEVCLCKVYNESHLKFLQKSYESVKGFSGKVDKRE